MTARILDAGNVSNGPCHQCGLPRVSRFSEKINNVNFIKMCTFCIYMEGAPMPIKYGSIDMRYKGPNDNVPHIRFFLIENGGEVLDFKTSNLTEILSSSTDS